MLAEGRPQFPFNFNPFYQPVAFPGSWFNNFFPIPNFFDTSGIATADNNGTTNGWFGLPAVGTGVFAGAGGGVSTGGFASGGGSNFVSSGGSSVVSSNGESSITSFHNNCVDGVCDQSSLLCTNGDCTQTKYKDDKV